MPKAPLLQVENLKFEREENEILKGVSFSINRNEIFCVIGPNGSGKSTLASILMGIKRQDSGKIIFQGKDISRKGITERAKNGISLAWQEPARFEGISIRDFLSINAKVSPEKALSLVRLSPEKYLDREINSTLSGGERKRVELASMLTLKPKLAILDEPDSGIDFVSLDDLIKVVKMMKKAGTSVIIITHREEVARHADRSMLICGGCVAKTGKSTEVSEYFRKKCGLCNIGDINENEDENFGGDKIGSPE
ncbi:MAG: ATP-binding cassette domain-containing protein [Candidatus Woesearchaeota archaeon]|nr:ATP-binding cassette domain-containing protein [Candidatus Woesearchaeota archaeon]